MARQIAQPGARVLAERELGYRGTLSDFLRMSWPLIEPGASYVHSWHIDLLSEHYTALLAGEIRRLVVNVPPGMSKSVLSCIAFPTWAWLRRPELRWIFTSYSLDVSTRDARKSLELMQSAWFRERWGETVAIGTALGGATDRDPAVRDIANTRGGARRATMTGGGITGFHANIHGIDDPIKPMDVARGADGLALSRAIEYLQGTLASRFLHGQLNAMFVIMQRLHENDLAGHILAHHTDATHVCLPMEYDPRRRCVTPWGADPRTEPGELLAPARANAEDVTTLKASLGPVQASAQLGQDPIPDSGSIFQREWFRYYKTIPEGLANYTLSVDCAFKGGESSDFVVAQVWATSGASMYLLDQARGRWTFTETVRQIKAMITKWPGLRAKLIEDKANGSAVLDTLGKEFSGLIPVTPEGGKIARANAVTAYFQAGNVFFPEGAPWCAQDLEPELLKFPRGSHDDQTDTLTQALNYLGQHRNNLAAAMVNAKRMWGV